MIFRSSLADVAVHESGWTRLPSGVEITSLPLWDSREHLFARLGHGEAGSWLTARGMRLPTKAELGELHQVSLYVPPVTLPTPEMIVAAGVPKPWRLPDGKDSPAMSAYRVAHMRSRAWCEQHDAEVWRRLHGAGCVDQPVANAGKHWGAGGHIYGWWLTQAGDKMIQGWSSAHAGDPTYTDYATTVHAVRDRDVVKVLSEPPITGHPPLTRLGAKGAAVLLMQRWLLSEGYQLPRYGTDGHHGAETQTALDAWKRDVAADTERAPATVASLVSTYRQARYYGRGRPRGDVNSITIHVSQSAESARGAEALGEYAATMADGRVASWHFGIDCDSTVQCVDVDDRAHAAGPGNDRSVHIEICGRVEQGAAGWADAYSQAALARCGALVAALCRECSIPAERRHWSELLSDKAGIYGHSDWTRACQEAHDLDLKRNPWWDPIKTAWRTTTHQDPGAAFPWDQLLALVAAHVR